MRHFLILILFLFLTTGCSSYKKNKDYVFASTEGKARYIKSYDAALKLWDIPLEEADIATSYGMAHVVMSGPKTGEPVILFHGMDASSSMWFPNAKALSQNNRVYAIDFPLETGKSLACANKLRNKDIALFYNEIFEHYKMKNINLIGASRGGWMAIFLALQSQNKIKRLILLSPAQTFNGIRSPFKLLTAVTLKIFPSRKRLDKFFNAFSYYPDKIDPLYKEQFYLANVYGSSKPHYMYMTKFSKNQLQSLKIPVLVLVGDHDIVNNEESVRKAHELIPNVETAFIKDAGHFLSIDQAAIINTTIVDFLNKN
jgi:pimeloyl-ACP methyl ester carboxylesterase